MRPSAQYQLLLQLAADGGTLSSNSSAATVRDETKFRWDENRDGFIAIDRAKVSEHIRIVQSFWLEHNDAGARSPKAIVLAGPPGAGKSTALKDLVPDFFETETHALIDGDDVKTQLLTNAVNDGTYSDQFLPLVTDHVEAGAQFFPNDFAGLVHHESMVLHGDLLNEGIDRRANLVIDGTLSWRQYGERILTRLRAAGYRTQLIADVEASRHEAERHAYKRWRAGYEAAVTADPAGPKPLGGRIVPEAAYNSIFGSASGVSTTLVNARALSAEFSVPLRVFFPSRQEPKAELVFDSAADGPVLHTNGGRTSARCSVCGRPISSARSLETGIGPGCARAVSGALSV